jgi:hypothetical protein|tara:strand:- start:642 stop:1076 length:435 start_codon:yes stop_codon:yes gene_type:complete
MDTGIWEVYKPIPEGTFGFIYEIINTINNKKYIGKKQMVRKIKRKPLKGKKRKRIDFIESDWKTYTGSSDALNNDISLLGLDKFNFKILKFCNSKFELSYFETKMQFEKDVLLSENYYNGIINCRIGKAPKLFLEQYYNKSDDG